MANLFETISIASFEGTSLDVAIGGATASAYALQVAGVHNTSAPTLSNGQGCALQLDASGNLNVNIGNIGAVAISGVAATYLRVGIPVTSVWNSSTLINTNQTIFAVNSAYGQQAILMQLDQTTTITGGVITIQGSYDGVNYITLNAYQVVDPTTLEPLGAVYTLQASTNKAFLIFPMGMQDVQISLTTVITGTGTVTPYVTDWASMPFQFVGGIYNSTPPTLTNGQATSLQLDSSGNLKVTGTSTVSGTITANQGSPNTLANAWTVEITDGTNVLGTSSHPIRIDPTGTTTQPVSLTSTTITGTVAVTQSTNPWTVQGDSASGASNAGNPVKIGGAFNTTQPTVSNTQTVDAQMTARGAQIVATGVDAFAVNASQTGTWTVQQGGAPWSVSQSGTWSTRILGNAGAAMDGTIGVNTAPANGLAVLSVYNLTAPAPANGQSMAQQADQSGNHLVFPGVQFITGAVWGTGTSQNTLQYPTGTTTQGQLNSGDAVLVQLDISNSTFTGGAVTFQGTYDNVNWITIPTAQVLNPQTFTQLTNPYTFVANSNVPFLLLTQGFIGIRAKLTVAITGSSTPTVTPYWSTLGESPLQAVSIAGPLDGNGWVEVDLKTAIPAGTNTIGKVGIDQTTLGTTNGVTVIPATVGGNSAFVQQALTTSAQVKSAAGQVYGYSFGNPNSSAVWMFFYNTTSAPTIGSTTNLVYEIMLPASQAGHISFPQGIAFSSGIFVAVATTATGNTAPGTGITITTLYT